MPSSAKSHACSSIRRCTDVVRDVEATGLHIATAGGRCALHFYTPQGTTVVRLPAQVFVEAAHAKTDGNGNLWPKAREESRR